LETKPFTDRERNEHGWIIYPGRDTDSRKDWDGDSWDKAKTHPAKMRAEVFLDIMEYVSKPGETILDPFGGIGTTAAAALYGRNVILVEVEQYYADIASEIYRGWEEEGRATGSVTVICQDNRQVLPLPCNHIITSPPYGSDLYKAAGALEGSDFYEGSTRMQDMVEQYGQHPLNIGRLNKFMYQKQMDKLYKKMVDSIPAGGTISITHRDRTENGERVLYAMGIIKSMASLGMGIKLMERWDAPTSVQNTYNKSIGLDVVTEEDILIFEKLA